MILLKRIKHATWMEMGKTAIGARMIGLYTKIVKKSINSVQRDTDLVVEGFPRSANTYALAKIRIANPLLKIAHHIHGVGQLKLALLYGIPCVVLVRKPIDAVASLVIREPGATTKYSLNNYIHFYKYVLKNREHFIIAEFQEVINDFDGLVGRTSKRYNGLRLTEVNYTKIDVKNTVEKMDKDDTSKSGIDPKKVALPSAEREREKIVVCEHLRVECGVLIGEADEIYHKLIKKSGKAE